MPSEQGKRKGASITGRVITKYYIFIELFFKVVTSRMALYYKSLRNKGRVKYLHYNEESLKYVCKSLKSNHTDSFFKVSATLKCGLHETTQLWVYNLLKDCTQSSSYQWFVHEL